MTERPSFRKELERLEAIVRGLEDEDVDLDAALELFREGVERLKTARQVLEETELVVKKVVEAVDSDAQDADVDD